MHNCTIVELFFLPPPPIWIRGWQWKVHNSSSKSCAPLKDAGPNQNASDRGATLVFLNVCPDFSVPISLLLNTRASCCNVSDPKTWISAKKTDSSRYECQLYPTAETCSWHFAIVIKIYLRIFFLGETVTALYALQRFSCCAFVFYLRDTSITLNMSSLHLQIAKACVLMPIVVLLFLNKDETLPKQKKANEIEFHDIKPVYFEDAQVDHCYAPFEVTVEK